MQRFISRSAALADRNHALWMDDREIPARQTDGASLNARAFSTTSCCRKPAWSRNRPTSLIGRGTRSDVVSVFLLSGDPVALRQAEGGTPPADICRQLGVSEATFYIWKKKYAHLGVSELRKLRSLEDENARLKRLVADLSARQAHARRRRCEKKSKARHAAASWPLGFRPPIAWQRACGPVTSRNSAARRGIGRAGPRDQAPLRLRIRELAHARPRFGVLTHLGVAATGGLDGESETRTAALSPGRPAAAHGRPATQTHRPAPRPGARADRPDRAVEYGFRA